MSNKSIFKISGDPEKCVFVARQVDHADVGGCIVARDECLWARSCMVKISTICDESVSLVRGRAAM